jgi:LmbE family N-acetylglucosaminyl deacetylase
MVRQRWIAVLLALVAVAPAGAAAQKQDLEHEGAAALGVALRRLGVTQRVLMVGAHPDDENSALIATLALGAGADVAYLSLTRGEGGQNLIGPELQEGLGLIRSEELLSARRLDGAQQFFTRAIDYGFSKSADEAFRHWPADSLLSDVVAVVRRFRPDVIVPVFSGTPRDGHGQHQVSGIMAREALRAAADPDRFPGQIAAGLPAHETPAAFQALYRPGDPQPFYLSSGDLDPLLGRSYFQIAMASRSRHRSQDMGVSQPPGPNRVALEPIATPASNPPTTMFAGLDTTLSQRAAGLTGAAELAQAFRTYEGEVARAREAFNPLHPGALVRPLAEALRTLDRARPLLPGEARDLRFHLEAERDDVIAALLLAAGIIIDAIADDPILVPGQEFELTLRLWNGGVEEIAVRDLEPSLPAGWRATALDPALAVVAPGALAERRFRISVAHDAAPSEPYFLRNAREGDMYEWPADVAVRGVPFEPGAVGTAGTIAVGGVAIAISETAAFIEVDKAMGERRLPILVVPAVGVNVEPAVAVVPIGVAAESQEGGGSVEREVSVVLRGEAPDGIQGTLRLEVPEGWNVEPWSRAVALRRPGERATLRFRVRPPASITPGEHAVRAVFDAGDDRFERGYDIIAYPHTNPRLLFQPATVRFMAFPVQVASNLRVGYVEGAGDDGAEVLRQLGAEVDLLDASALATAELARYSAIVAGIRAYEVRPDLLAANARLLDYVERGGTFIVQYNKQEYAEGDFAPYTLTMARSAGRVTDEESPVRLLDPTHPVLTTPNRIGPEDFEGWIQERGLYFLASWAPEYTPLLGLTDPGEEEQEGSLLVARHGQGRYVYVALSFFRQWPQGVAGAYRLMANLVSLGGS